MRRRKTYPVACLSGDGVGPELTVEQLNAAFRRFKELADTRKAVTLYDVFEKEVV